MGKRLRKLIPYWLRSHEQSCAGCEALHALAVEVRCVACDRPYCTVCVIVVNHEAFCSECHAHETRGETKGAKRPWRRVRSGKAS